VKKKLPILGIEARQIRRLHIDGEIRRELRNSLGVARSNRIPGISCHDVNACRFHTFAVQGEFSAYQQWAIGFRNNYARVAAQATPQRVARRGVTAR
jgi:hypothetical protein